MKRILLAVAVTISVTSCSIFKGTDYIIDGCYMSPSSVQLPDGRMVDISSGLPFYEDENILIAPNVSSDAITIQIQNSAPESIKVLWDDAVFIDQQGLSHRIIHVGTKYTDKEKAQVPSVIAPASRIEETLYPSDYINWTNGAWGSQGWQKQSIYNVGQTYATLQEAQATINELMMPVKLLLPIESNEKKNEYIFLFDGKSATIREQNWDKTYLIPIICVAAPLSIAALIYAMTVDNDN